MITFFGTGLLGANFVRAFLRRGENMQVWNRTAEKAKNLEAEGARAFADPAEAVRGAARLHMALSDDSAVDEVLERALPGLRPETIIVDHTTTSPAETAKRAVRWAGRGYKFQHAPVFMGPQNALEASGIMMASGERTLFEMLEPELKKMTGKLVYLGSQPERAAAMKLIGNLFLISMTVGLIDAMRLAKAMAIDPGEVEALFGFFNPVATVGPRLKRIRAGDFAHPSWGLAMARKDARLIMEAARNGEEALIEIPGVAAEMDRWIEKGFSQEDWTVMAKDALDASS